MLKLLTCILKDTAQNEEGRFSHTKIGLMLALTVFLCKIAIMPNELFLEHLTEITITVVALTGSRSLVNSFSERIKK